MRKTGCLGSRFSWLKEGIKDDELKICTSLGVLAKD